MKGIMKLKRVYKMISATAPPGMPIERGMVASWIPETSQPGSREYDKKNNIIQLQASGGGPDRSRKQQAKKVLTPAVGPGNVSLERKHNENT